MVLKRRGPCLRHAGSESSVPVPHDVPSPPNNAGMFASSLRETSAHCGTTPTSRTSSSFGSARIASRSDLMVASLTSEEKLRRARGALWSCHVGFGDRPPGGRTCSRETGDCLCARQGQLSSPLDWFTKGKKCLLGSSAVLFRVDTQKRDRPITENLVFNHLRSKARH